MTRNHNVDSGIHQDAVVGKAIRAIVPLCDPDAIIVFGSRARGEETPASDLDLLVICSQITSRRETRIAIRIALSNLGVPKDVLVASSEDVRTHGQVPGTVLKTALEEGIVVYERAP
ncbi:MAG: nucleotidyltransferase domain-containing protein [Gemmatimonadota bacterium]